MVDNLLPTPPATPAFPSESEYPSHPERRSLAQLEQRIANLEESNVILLQAFARYAADNTTAPTALPPSTPTSPIPSSSALITSQKVADQRCFLLSQRVQALQSQLTQCVDACSSALETERDVRSDLERDNQRLSDEVRVLREDRDTLERQLKRLGRMRNISPYSCELEELRPRTEQPYYHHHLPPLKEEADLPPVDNEALHDTLDDAVEPSTARLARLRLSTLSDASTVVEEEIIVSNRPATRNSWYMMADKARYMLSSYSTGPSVVRAAHESPPPEDTVNEASRGSFDANRLQRLAHRASLILSDAMRTYGELPAAEGVVL